MGLDGHVALVTGSTYGLGRAIASALHDEGAAVMLTGRDAETGKSAVDALGEPERAAFVAGDVLQRGVTEAFVDATIDRFGKLDILVNNAGGVVGSGMGPFPDVTFDDWLGMFMLNVHSTFAASQRALPGMVEQGWGRIINMSSVEGKQGVAGQCAYSTTKHTLAGLTKSLAREVGTTGVTVNAICPGLCATEKVIDPEHMTEIATSVGMTMDELIGSFTAETAIKRLIGLEEVAGLAVFLTSDAAAAITGAQLSIDGGQSSY